MLNGILALARVLLRVTAWPPCLLGSMRVLLPTLSPPLQPHHHATIHTIQVSGTVWSGVHTTLQPLPAHRWHCLVQPTRERVVEVELPLLANLCLDETM